MALFRSGRSRTVLTSVSSVLLGGSLIEASSRTPSQSRTWVGWALLIALYVLLVASDARPSRCVGHQAS